MEQPPKQMRPPTSSDSFSSRLLGQILQLSLVKYPLKLLQKASVWIGLVLPVESIRNRLCPPSQSPSRPGLLRLLLSLTPTSIQNLLCHLPTDWSHSSMSKEIQEAPINPTSKASKRKRDDVALEQQESWFEVLERDLPEDDPEDFSYEPSELESDSEEYQTQNDTDLELEEQGEMTELELPAVQSWEQKIQMWPVVMPRSQEGMAAVSRRLTQPVTPAHPRMGKTRKPDLCTWTFWGCRVPDSLGQLCP
ncbi:uncharacterized protein LOC135458860 isoform X1 [Zonotrichia leucophrys gambelii]|uniref:uncharacterized protein LOC135458860 isoform X1 n=1 Tax=Zonotrichia leucophrys gambelii TaxID=257770 RepID=UPI003140BF00